MSTTASARVVSRRDFLSEGFVEFLEAPFLLIQDSLAISACHLLSSVFRTILNQQSLCLVITETAPVQLADLLPTPVIEGRAAHQLSIVDAWSNAGGWQQPESVALKSALKYSSSQITTLDTLQQSILSVLKGSTSPAYLAFDSISPLIRKHGVARVSLFLQNLATSHRSLISHLVAAVHTDLHSDSTLRSLEYISTCSVRLSVPADSKLGADGSALITQKRRSGKLHKVTEYYRVELGCIRLVKPVGAGTGVTDTSPLVEATFNLGLTQEQKAAKDAVKLPYQHQGKPEEGDLILGGNDEEEGSDDPDADLDI